MYNSASRIRRSLDSVLSQTYGDFEIVIVDDGSQDDGGDIALQYDDERIRLTRQENKGVSAARNRGIAEARGEIVAFLDADDEWRPNHLETLVELYDFCDSGGVYTTGCVLCEEDFSLPTEVFADAKKDIHVIVADPFLAWTFMQFNNSSTTAVRKSVLEAEGGFPEGVSSGEDLSLWIRLAARYPVVASPKATAVFYQTGIEGKPRYKKWEQRIVPAIKAAELLQPGLRGISANPISIRKYIRHRIRLIFWSYVSADAREPLKTALENSDAKRFTPICHVLVRTPFIWPLLRKLSIVNRFFHSRLYLQLRGGEIRKRGAVIRLVQHDKGSWKIWGRYLRKKLGV
jgi:glycosyltransferase involved in cell wall biosynthesis